MKVVTFKEIDKIDEKLTGTAKRNFITNNIHFIKGVEVDYFVVKPIDVRCTNFVL